MHDTLIVLLVLYIVVGAVVYFITDSTTLASRIESATPFTWGMVRNAIFLGVVALWPLWLVYRLGAGGDSRQ
jgi:hypothetical protein